MSKLFIKPMSEESPALQATEGTFRLMPQGGPFARDKDGELVRNGDGLILVDAVNPEFVYWACIQQGYVAAASLVKSITDAPDYLAKP